MPVIPYPTFLQGHQSTDISRVNLLSAQNVGVHYMTIGQVFGRGELFPGDQLIVRTAGVDRGTQWDARSLYSDGSVSIASLTFTVPTQGGGVTPLTFGKKPWTPTTSVTYAPTVVVTFTGGITQTLDFTAALAASTDTWLNGPFAVQRRAEMTIAGTTFKVIVDATMYANGKSRANIRLANIIAKTSGEMGTNVLQPMPARLRYDVTATLGTGAGAVSKTYTNVQQMIFTTADIELSDDPFVDARHFQHDTKRMAALGFIPNYDFDKGVNDSAIVNRCVARLNDPRKDVLFYYQGLTTYMGTTGGRPDIGTQPMEVAMALITQDPRAVDAVMTIARANGSWPWMMQLTDGKWANIDGDRQLGTANTQDSHMIWCENQSFPNFPANDCPDWTEPARAWKKDYDHQPDYIHVPYLLTTGRHFYDQAISRACINIVEVWIGNRDELQPHNNGWSRNGQVRGIAWRWRHVLCAWMISAPGSWERGYLQREIEENLAWMNDNTDDMWNSANPNCQIKGFLPSATLPNPHGGDMGPWQGHYHSTVFGWFANFLDAEGISGAKDWLDFGAVSWTAKMLLTTAADAPWNAKYATAQYVHVSTNNAFPKPAGQLDTWVQVANATPAPTTLGYWEIHMAALAAVSYAVPDQEIKDAYAALVAAAQAAFPPDAMARFLDDPTWSQKLAA